MAFTQLPLKRRNRIVSVLFRRINGLAPIADPNPE